MDASRARRSNRPRNTLLPLMLAQFLAVTNLVVRAECPNACSGHGSCGAFDMCVCQRNWMGGDCGERVCPFGRAFMDSPKGDLDGSEHITGATETILLGSDVYELGTTEEFPKMTDSLGNALTQTAHEYTECSNSGRCDRTLGQCLCYPYFFGASCDKKHHCPNDCSGHGKCTSLKKTANDDYGSIYGLWDATKILGCDCDPGYAGFDCAQRLCPRDVDPVYSMDRSRTVAVTVVTITIKDDFCTESMEIEAYPFLRRLSDVERGDSGSSGLGGFGGANNNVYGTGGGGGGGSATYSDEVHSARRGEYVRRGLLSLDDKGTVEVSPSFFQRRRRRLLVAPTVSTIVYEVVGGYDYANGIPDSTAANTHIATISADNTPTEFVLAGDDAAKFTLSAAGLLATAEVITYAGSTTGTLTITVAGKNADGTQDPATTFSITVNPVPTVEPTPFPTKRPTPAPTARPTREPTLVPTAAPTSVPTPVPSKEPTPFPTKRPTPAPTARPTREPTLVPTKSPTSEPSLPPTALPSPQPSPEPTLEPTKRPTPAPTARPTREPTLVPTASPTLGPTTLPTLLPTLTPSLQPTLAPSLAPTLDPTSQPTLEPTASPTLAPTPEPTLVPTTEPTLGPTTLPTLLPTLTPSLQPTLAPSLAPTLDPTSQPTLEPTASPTLEPTASPTLVPTLEPTAMPSLLPTPEPSLEPTTLPTLAPSSQPTLDPTTNPTLAPSLAPSALPTLLPSLVPTPLPSLVPTPLPTLVPTAAPSGLPTLEPTSNPTPLPTIAFFHTDSTMTGTFALKFYDTFGEDFVTKPIKLEDYTDKHDNQVAIDPVNSCPNIIDALEALPNTVVSPGSVWCEEQAWGEGYASECGVSYSLTFTGNPGYLKELEVDYYLDGRRATIFNHFGEPGVNVSTEVYGSNNVGEVDYFYNKCDDVTVYSKFLEDKYLGVNKWGYLDLDSSVEYAHLAKCLGDSDGHSVNNVEVYNWDYGSTVLEYDTQLNQLQKSLDKERMSGTPHIVKLVPKIRSSIYERARLAVVWVSQLFRGDAFGASHTGYQVWMANPPEDETTEFIPFTTDGIAEVIYYDANGNKELDITQQTEPRVTARFTRGSNVIYTSYDTSCETSGGVIEPCLDKGDLVFLFDLNWGRRAHQNSTAGQRVNKYGTDYFGTKGFHKWKSDTGKSKNPYHYNNYYSNTGQMYTVKKIYRHKVTATTYKLEDRYRIVMDKNLNWGDENITAGSDPDGDGVFNTGFVQMLKFSPATTGNLKYVDECSGRGKCSDEGGCLCDAGFAGVACEIWDSHYMSSIAM